MRGAAMSRPSGRGQRRPEPVYTSKGRQGHGRMGTVCVCVSHHPRPMSENLAVHPFAGKGREGVPTNTALRRRHRYTPKVGPTPRELAFAAVTSRWQLAFVLIPLEGTTGPIVYRIEIGRAHV